MIYEMHFICLKDGSTFLFEKSKYFAEGFLTVKLCREHLTYIATEGQRYDLLDKYLEIKFETYRLNVLINASTAMFW